MFNLEKTLVVSNSYKFLTLVSFFNEIFQYFFLSFILIIFVSKNSGLISAGDTKFHIPIFQSPGVGEGGAEIHISEISKSSINHFYFSVCTLDYITR